MTRIAPLAALLATLAVAGPAHAVPCGSFATTGGVYQSTACRNGASGDANDSAADLNDGSYFGFNTWQELARTSDEGEGAFWNVDFQVGSNGRSGVMGTFTLGPHIWNYFKDLVVVLKDGGSFTDRNIKWSAYLLPRNQYGTYNWSYDGGHKQLSHMTLYGRLRTVAVAEPAPIALLAAGLAALGLARARRTAVRAPR